MYNISTKKGNTFSNCTEKQKYLDVKNKRIQEEVNRLLKKENINNGNGFSFDNSNNEVTYSSETRSSTVTQQSGSVATERSGSLAGSVNGEVISGSR